MGVVREKCFLKDLSEEKHPTRSAPEKVSVRKKFSEE